MYVYRYGSSVKLMRRDLKPGQQSATAARTPAGGVRVSFEWGAPAAGSLDEQYEMMPGERDRMSVTSQLNVGGNTARVVQVGYTHTRTHTRARARAHTDTHVERVVYGATLSHASCCRCALSWAARSAIAETALRCMRTARKVHLAAYVVC